MVTLPLNMNSSFLLTALPDVSLNGAKANISEASTVQISSRRAFGRLPLSYFLLRKGLADVLTR
jgi:hypothetical protein